MTERELLELAARAVGWWDAEFNCYNGPVQWDPLTDPGDALRLAVALHLHAKQFPITDDGLGPPLGMVEVGRCDDEDPLHVEYLKSGDDRLAATMRAITRAAAEIGRAKT